MATKQLGWLIALLVATPGLYVACGGDDSSGTAGGTGGAGGATMGTGGAGGAGATGGTTGGTAGATGGTAGAAGTAGKGGGTTDAGPVMCGNMTCSSNPTMADKCDTANMRCVDCLNDGDCAVETVAKICDMRPNMQGLPAMNCIQCLDNSHCPTGATCGMNNTCTLPCGTANCTTNPTGNDKCDAPNNRCVDCMNDADCAVETTDKYCDTTTLNMAGLPVYSCEQCLVDAHCMAGQTCVNNSCVTMCGTAQCSTTPTGNDKCDLANNRCVDCLTNADCAVEMNAPHCDMTPNTAGLPRYVCEECVTNAHCPMGQVCIDNECEPTCTTDAQCSADGGGNSPHCNPTTMTCAECGSDAHCAGQMNQPYCAPNGSCVECNTDTHCAAQTATPYCFDNECVECLTDAHCATQMNQPFCRTSDNNCVQCRDANDCTAPQSCNRSGTCTGGGGGDAGGTSPDSGGSSG